MSALTITVHTYAAQQSEPQGGFAGWATDLMEKLGAPGAGLAIALENLFPPIPSEVVLPLAGFASAQGDMNLIAALIWTTLGSVAGALVLYGLGAVIGHDRMRRIVGKVPLVKVDDLDKSQKWFAKHGSKAVFFGRMIPVFRSLISIPAGVEGMGVMKFTAYTALGSGLWNTAFVMAGYLLGDNWQSVEGYVGMYSKGVLAVLVIGFAAFVAIRIRQNRKERSGRERETAS